ncbi:MAG: branched-chain amino acid ABC transporter permease [Acidimicrobiia bacterium]|nr:branched-chain amino acid ABC transporter permease [Acidimicrobiia bacterium]
MRLRPGLVTDYRADAGIFKSVTQRIWFGLLLAAAVFLGAGGAIGPIRISSDIMVLLAYAMFASIGALGLNIVTGMAGQVSLGHAFFLGLGAYTAAILGGVEQTRQAMDPVTGQQVTEVVLRGYGLDMIIWLPLAGIIAALAGLIVAPVATRLRGLYLAFVTLGLVFLGEHIFREARTLTGGAGNGRPTAEYRLFGFRFDQDGEVFGIWMSKQQKLFFLGLILLLVMGLAAKNLFRSRVGRALAAIRDRDIAAEMMGIPLGRYKLIAFTISSFYAGIAGALFWAVVGRLTAEGFNFLLSIKYIAMILIGGVATVSGSIMGAFFITFLPKVVEGLAGLPGLSHIISKDPAGMINTFQFEQILFGLFIVGFLILEPMGLYGIWIRVRNYWKGWPFSY